jgi:hypothetical protein
MLMARAAIAMVTTGLVALAATQPVLAASDAVTDPWLHLGVERALAPMEQPARTYLAAVPATGTSRPKLSQAQSAQQSDPEAVPHEVKEAIACGIGGTAATAAAFAAGAENLVHVISGGVVAPANSGVLYIGVMGVVFVAFCEISQSLLPIYLHLTKPSPSLPDAAAGSAACPGCVMARSDDRAPAMAPPGRIVAATW